MTYQIQHGSQSLIRAVKVDVGNFLANFLLYRLIPKGWKTEYTNRQWPALYIYLEGERTLIHMKLR